MVFEAHYGIPQPKVLNYVETEITYPINPINPINTKKPNICHHLEGTTRYALYAVNKFFVEVEYNTITNKIVNKVSFKTGDKLDRYSNLDSLI
ncbi:hypothetical protein OOZ15_11895 [Galbibacter sp. EGI 63066]|uniref:hypothetical protein n=1 Tax=Galbibacter sp. EGI 63066 TaxID=2993559 RepID=UPI0022495C95|nr:hypothetical protein [Galbibacter sp. EGI 63066]MCX2680646.1 hypothetical protein [Galbibacter sp. EGI 63066]